MSKFPDFSSFPVLLGTTGAGTAAVLATAVGLADSNVTEIETPDAPERVQAVENEPSTAAPKPELETTTVSATPVAADIVAPEGGYGLGREALATEVAAWDIDVRPDGQGLPEGSGDVWTGEEVFVAKCASCHGDFGEAVGRWPVLAGGQGTLSDEDPVKTIGSYWPYLSTVFDYVNRAMPFGEAQSLEPDEVYAITAYLLYVNDLVDDDFELSSDNFAEFALPNQDNFYLDDRADKELGRFTVQPCMEACKDSVEITMRATVLDVTPETEDDGAEEVAETQTEAAVEPEAQPESTEQTEEASTESIEAESEIDPELIAAGEGVFRQCKSCHQVGEGATNRSGPHLNNLVGRIIGSVDGFRYSKVFKEAAEAGDTWTPDRLAEFLADPRGAMPRTKMSFRGIGDPDDIAALIAYLEAEGG